jgi:thiamine kinase-like enzyme
MTDPSKRVASLPFWKGPVTPEPLSGGITNQNFLVDDAGRKYVVRLGGDIPVHQVMRFNELAASRAAQAAGISPEVVYNQPGVLVLRFIEGKVFGEADVRVPENLTRILPLLKACHRELPKHLRGPALVFWVFHVIRDYGHSLAEGKSRHLSKLSRLLEINEALERAVGRIDLVFGHNDLLPANLIDDGERLWLIDWDYAGFNSPLFDLANLASNNQLEPDQEAWLLENYFDGPADADLRRRYNAMKCASLLRETFWSMVSEIHSELDFDYSAYTAETLDRFERAYGPLQKELNAS